MDIYWLSQIQAAERALVGNELFVLSQLLQDEHPILPGFVLSNSLWRQFLLLADIEPSIKNIDRDYRQLQSFARSSREAIARAIVPDAWQEQILRAAQQLNSSELILQPCLTSPYAEIEANGLWLPATCNCNPEALTEAVKSAWAEVFSASSLIYLQKLGLSESINLSILVRPLKNAVASGTIAIDDRLIKIDATWGLEQSLLQGDVEPDSYYLDRESGEIIFRHLGRKNYSYRLKDTNAEPINDCLEAYFPSEDLATTYALEPEAIAELIQQTQNIIQRQPQIKYLTWTAIKSPGAITQYYFIRLSDRLVIPINVPAEIDATFEGETPLITGIAVSSGITQAQLAVIADLSAVPEPMPIGVILVTKEITPQQIHLIKEVEGIITETGGKNSHAAIVARELNIPAIVNATDATKILHNGDRVLLDGDNGRVYAATVDRLHRRPSVKKALSPAYPIATRLMVNLSQPASIAAAVNLPIDGVGLLRSELMLADLLANRTLAQWQESFKQQFIEIATNYLRSFVTAFYPRPIFYRSLDLYGRDSTNPVFGDRGTYSYLSDPTLFDLELTVLKTIIDEGHHNLNLILPFVRGVNEFEFCYRRIANIGLTAQANFQVWIMAEVPSIIYLLPEYIRAGVRGIAIGTNDFTQLFLGVDREQNQFSDRGLNANHTAMHCCIEQLIKTAHEYDIECCICGQAPVEYPNLIDRLIQWGIDAISVEPAAVAQTYKAIARAEKRLLLKEVTSKDD